MNPASDGSAPAILDALGSGLPMLLLQFLLVLALLVAGIFIFVNFAMDIMYAWLDPRIRYR